MLLLLNAEDFGIGVPREVLDRFWKSGIVGVGVAGTRERPEKLGGFLEIESNLDGTTLKATIPASPLALDTGDRNPALSSQVPSTHPAD